MLAFLAVYVPLSGWRMERRLGLYLVGLYILSQVPPVCFHKLFVADAAIWPGITAIAHLPGEWSPTSLPAIGISRYVLRPLLDSGVYAFVAFVTVTVLQQHRPSQSHLCRHHIYSCGICILCDRLLLPLKMQQAGCVVKPNLHAVGHRAGPLCPGGRGCAVDHALGCVPSCCARCDTCTAGAHAQLGL